MNRTKTRVLAGLICAVLVMTDIMTVGLVAQAAEVSQQTYIEMGNVEELESSKNMIDKEVGEAASADDMTEDEFEELKLTEDRIDTENVETGEVEMLGKGNSDEEAEPPDISLFIEDEDVEIEEPETAEVLAAAEDIIAEGTYTENGSNTAWVIDGNGKLTVTGTGEVKPYWDNDYMPWDEYSEQIITAEIRVSGMQDASSMFFRCTNLKSIDVREFDTSEVTNMFRMFAGCESLTELLGIEGFKTGNVTDMKMMFWNCNSLPTLNVAGFDTSNVTDMSEMFDYCSSLQELDVTGFDTSNVISMWGMFADCSSLTEVKLGEFKNYNLQNVDMMFWECRNLEKVDVDDFNTSNVTSMRFMFSGCSSLTELNVKGFDTGNVTDMCSMFNECSSLTKLDVSGFDTSKVTNMDGMFFFCSNVTELDVSGWDTSKVTDMGFMFVYCEEVDKLDVSGWDTRNVTNMIEMFSGCISVSELDLRRFDTSKVTDMSYMFSGCKLTQLDLSRFNTEKVTNMEYMFQSCVNLTQLNLSSFDVGNVESMNEMFRYCNSLESIYTPINVKVSVSLPKPNSSDIWYRSDTGATLTELPQNLSYSILLTKNKKAEALSRIVAQKDKTNYFCGETVELDDLNVTYYGGDGTVRELNSTDYTTNIAQINQTMSIPGTKTLTVTYQNNGTTLTAEITLTVACLLDETNTTVTLPNTDDYDYIYNGEPKTPTPTVIYTPTASTGIDTSVILEEGKDYTVTYSNNIDAYEDTTEGATDAPTVIVNGIGAYSGTFTRTFTITKAAAPADMELKVYVPQCQTAHSGQTFDIASVFTNYGKITGYEITNVIESPANSGAVFSKTPETADINTNGILTYNTNAGAENDSAEITLNVSFANYQDALLTVTIVLVSKEITVISGIGTQDCVYTGNQVSYTGTAIVEKEDGTDITNQVELIYSYSGTQADGSTYADTHEAPINAGSYILTVAVSDSDEDYMGSAEYPFTISKAAVTITVKSITLTTEEIQDSLPSSYEYEVEGLLNEDILIKEPIFTYTDIEGNLLDAELIDRTQAGIYYILPSNADAGMNYEISYQKGTLTIEKKQPEQNDPEEISTIFVVTFDMMTHGMSVPSITDIETGTLIDAPEYPQEGERVTEGSVSYIFVGWYKDKTFAPAKKWNFTSDTVQSNITLYACWLTAAADANAKGANLSVQEIPEQTYTGNAIKPNVIVYSGDGTTLLKAGKDYTIKYFNNKDADTEDEHTKGGTGSSENDSSSGFTKDIAYIVITGKGNYQGTIYRNFHILPTSISTEEKNGNVTLASGFVLKYAEQLTMNAAKEQKPLSSLKYKKAMKVGTDYDVKLSALVAYNAQGAPIEEGSVIGENGAGTQPTIPQGYYGSFLMTVSGKGNYIGSFNKTIVVADKSYLMKYTTVTLGKNMKTRQYTGESLTLTPAYYDSDAMKYYAISDDGMENRDVELDGKDVFTVRVGKEYLRYGKDFTISYENNKAAGTATMIVIGMGEYMGSKNVTFKISGTPFNAKNILVSDNFMTSMSYTGKSLTQNNVILTANAVNGAPSQKLDYGTHYTISYKNNLNKGTATMTFTARPESGYSGSFKKTFKITALSLQDYKVESNLVATHSKNGAKPAFTLIDTEGKELMPGIDYTVSYKNNKAVTGDNPPTMIIKGKGNYTGTITVNFRIEKADIETAITDNTLTVSAVAVVKKDNMKFTDFKFKILDGKIALSVGETKDYTIDLSNCTDAIIQTYAEALEKEGVETTAPKPTIKIKGVGNYMGEKELSLAEYICVTKLTAKNLRVEIVGDNIYTGSNVEPEVKVFYYPNNDAGKDGTVADTTFNESNYQITYGNNNIMAGKNKGTVTITGTGLFGGSVTFKFEIVKKGIYQ